MPITKYNFKRDAELLKDMKEQLGTQTIKSDIAIWDEWFGGFQKGCLQIVCAATGHGKTTFLIAMAKQAVEAGLKVLYIGSEQPAMILQEVMEGYDIDFVLKDGYCMEECIGEEKYDLIIYDYLGAESGANGKAQEWQVFRDDADFLSNLAVRTNSCILVGCQGTDDLNNIKSFDEVKGSKYVAFAKQIMNKVSSGAYLIRKDNVPYLKMIKNRYGEFKPETMKLLGLDYKTKKFN